MTETHKNQSQELQRRNEAIVLSIEPAMLSGITSAAVILKEHLDNGVDISDLISVRGRLNRQQWRILEQIARGTMNPEVLLLQDLHQQRALSTLSRNEQDRVLQNGVEVLDITNGQSERHRKLDELTPFESKQVFDRYRGNQ